MSNVLIEKDKLDVLATAISNKSGEPLKLTLDEMVEAVDGIDTGGITPTGNINITQAGTTDVTNYATATVPQGQMYAFYSDNYATVSGVRKWKLKPAAEIVTGDDYGTPGFINDNTVTYGDEITYNAIAKNTTVTPTESSQTIGGANYMMEGAVTVGAISSTYVGSGITQRSSSDLTASGATVTVPSGYYAEQASKAVATGSATAAATISGTSATVSTGTNTLTLSKTVSNTPQVTAGYIASGTAGNSSVSLSASVTTKGATTYNTSSSDQTIASGTYLTGTQTIRGVTTSNLTADNIKNGVTVTVGDSADADRVLSVTGTYTGGGGSLTVATKTLTNTATTQTLSFSSLSGQPKYWFLRATTNVSSSGSTTYYYVTDCFYDGTNIKGNTFRIGSTRRVQNITSGISQSYSGNTLTITAGSSSGATPGQFYGTSNFGYELVYIY